MTLSRGKVLSLRGSEAGLSLKQMRGPQLMKVGVSGGAVAIPGKATKHPETSGS